MLVLIYRVREGVAIVRNPGMFSHEYSDREGYDPAKIGTTPEDTRHAYNKRWREVVNPMVELEAALLEAEAQWPGLLAAQVAKLRKCVRELELALSRYLRAERDPRYRESLNNEKWEQLEATIWSGFSLDGDDKLHEAIQAAISEFESALRPKLAGA